MSGAAYWPVRLTCQQHLPDAVEVRFDRVHTLLEDRRDLGDRAMLEMVEPEQLPLLRRERAFGEVLELTDPLAQLVGVQRCRLLRRLREPVELAVLVGLERYRRVLLLLEAARDRVARHPEHPGRERG